MGKRTQFERNRKIFGIDAIREKTSISKGNHTFDNSTINESIPIMVSNESRAKGELSERPLRPEIDVASSMEMLRLVIGKRPPRDGAAGDMGALIGHAPSCHLDDFLDVANDEFIEAAFAAVLRRDVDNRAFYYYMRQLDDGRSRLDVLSELLSSGEAAEKAASGNNARAVERQHDLLRVQIEERRAMPRRPVEVLGGGGRDASSPQVAARGGGTGVSPSAPASGYQGPSSVHAEIDIVGALMSIRERLSTYPATPALPGLGLRAPQIEVAGRVLKPVEMPRVHFPGGGRALDAQPVYRVEELLCGSEKEFLERTYTVLLGRKPDQGGEEYYLRMLLSGTTRIEVITSILASDEAMHRRVKVMGVTWRRWVARLGNWPVIGHACRRFADRSPADFVHVQSLQSFHDEDFVNRAYRSILGRAPDPSGAERYLRALRKGESKIRLIRDIRRSKEGRRRGVRVGGLGMAYLWEAAVDTPVLGGVLVFAASFVKTPDWRREARHREARTEHILVALNRNTVVMQQIVNSGFDVLKSAIDDIADQVDLLSEAHRADDLRTRLDILSQKIVTIEAQSNILRDSLIDLAKHAKIDCE
ncbi:DUF4214 domain-containing protein [Burkholderia cenocepacia]|uniref:DUF4214 domain-containing protein n=1 Tax=Burkholderia cenocepacia TaxID=95486 RepID=UPI000F59EBD1|nr:DUF4214 domain-containing protein [Burkholderia cenocepacia]RQU63361.1 DUF4214 domain-containing protein [Burkholderia cenocepacia]RQV46621.1 DUF4214 domain-containing protein [Burkholderia cenocepacia]